jgi:hypothetical protein
MRTSTGRAHSARTRPAAATDVHSTCAMRGSNGNTCVLRRTACTKSSSSSCSTARNPSQDTRACVCRCSLAPGITGIQGPAEQDKVRSRVRGKEGEKEEEAFWGRGGAKGQEGKGMQSVRVDTQEVPDRGCERTGGALGRCRGKEAGRREVRKRRWGRGGGEGESAGRRGG